MIANIIFEVEEHFSNRFEIEKIMVCKTIADIRGLVSELIPAGPN